MAKLLQLRRGNTAQHNTTNGGFTGAVGEVTVDTDKDTLVVHDGSTVGGSPLATANNPTFTGTVAIPNVANLETAVVANTAKNTNVNTDLSVSRDGTSFTVVSSDGTNASLPLADTDNWGVMSDEMFDKLDGIEASATADQTNAEIRAAVEAATDSNVFTDNDHSKLDGLVTNATHTGDVTGSTALTIAADAVETAMIEDDAVTGAKIADGAVVTAKIADDAVTAAKLAVAYAPLADPALTGTATAVNLTLSGDLTVNGTTTTIDTTNLTVEDPLISLAKNNNAANTVDIGFYGLYDATGSQDVYTGLFRDADDSGKWKLFELNQTAPTTTVNTSGTGYAAATLVVGTLEDSKGDVRTIPQNSKSASYTPSDRSDVGKHIYTDSAVVINNSVTWVAGDAITLVNKHASNDVTITFTNITAYLAGDATAKATITVAARGMGTILFTTATECFISGAGLS